MLKKHLIHAHVQKLCRNLLRLKFVAIRGFTLTSVYSAACSEWNHTIWENPFCCVIIMAPTPSLPRSKMLREYFFTEVRRRKCQCKKCSKQSWKWWLDKSYQSPANLCWDWLQKSIFGSSKSGRFDFAPPWHHHSLHVWAIKRKEMHQCIEFMVSFVEQISGQSLCCHILSLCDVMKETLQKEIPLQFCSGIWCFDRRNTSLHWCCCIIFHGWCYGNGMSNNVGWTTIACGLNKRNASSRSHQTSIKDFAAIW